MKIDKTLVTPNNWIDVLIDTLSSAVSGNKPIEWTDESGNEILVNIKQEMIDMLIQNRDKFIVIGIDAFKEFCALMNKGQSFDALIAVYAVMDNEQLIDQYKEDAIKLAEIARIEQEMRDFWVWLAKQVGMRIALGAIGAILP